MGKSVAGKATTAKKPDLHHKEPVYIGKYVHLFNKQYSHNEITALADLMIDWFTNEPKAYFFEGFRKQYKVSRPTWIKFRDNDYFAWAYDVCESIRLDRLGSKLIDGEGSTAGNIFAMKNTTGWTDAGKPDDADDPIAIDFEADEANS